MRVSKVAHLKNIIPPQQIELQAIEPNPTKSLNSNFQYAAISISKKKQRNFHKNKRKLKENILTRSHVSPGTA
jgi:hypothetical protein